MSKVDSKQDYYADLELKPNAEPEDIKKQFRKLAKLYHPDRNPGKEFEYNAKFQAIQAAHEVLTDPQQRTKYDAERQKATATNQFSNHWRAGNTPKTTPTSAHFPPPPKRPGAEKARFPTTGPQKAPNSTGNNRFASFAKTGAAEWSKAKDEAEARANSFRAWSNMGPRQGAPPAPPPPPPPPRPKFNPTAPRPAPPPPPPQSEHPMYPNGWNAQNSGNAGFPGLNRSQSTRKKPGYVPSTPGAYHEPMAPPNTSAYQHVSRGDRPQASKPQSYFDMPPQSPTTSHGKPATSPLRHAKSQEEPIITPQRPGGLGRNTTRYATAGGEKTYVGGGVSRSTSLRNSPVDPNYADHVFERPRSQHSSSRNHSRGPHIHQAFPDSESSSESSSSDDEPEIDRRPTAIPRGRFGHPKAKVRQWHGEKVPGSNLHSPQRNQTAHYEYPPPPPRSVPNMVHVDGADRSNIGVHPSPGIPKENKYGPFLSSARRWSQEWGFSLSASAKSPKSKDPSWALPATVSPECLAKKKTSVLSEPRSGDSSLDSYPYPFPKSGPRQTVPSLKANHLFQFSPPVDSQADSPQPAPKTSTHEQLHTPFSASEWAHKLSNGDEIFAPPPNRPPPSREKSPSKMSNSRGRAFSRGKPPSPVRDQVPPPSMPASKDESTPKFAPAQFSGRKSVEEARDPTWLTPHSDLSRKTSSKPQAKPVASNNFNDARSAPGNAETETGNETAKDRGRNPGETADVMDIDDGPQENSTEHQTNGNDTAKPSHTPHIHPHEDDRPISGGVNLNDLTNTAPFAPSASGLNGMVDLGANLPFESRPAASLKLDDTTTRPTEDLSLPKPPKAPTAPLDSDRLTRPVWERYCSGMNAYMKEWTSYNNKILSHFTARQELVSSCETEKWFSGLGDVDLNGKASLGTYCGWMQQDEKVRAAWDVSNEHHNDAMNEARKARELAKQKAFSGKL